MTRWLAAAHKAGGEAKPAIPQPGEVVSVMSVLSEGVRPVARPTARASGASSRVTAPSAENAHYASLHGLSVAGHPLTWTGCVVSPSAWSGLTEWQRYGPNGRHWNGITQEWE